MTDTDKTQGFLAGLTNEQRTAALAYSGDDLHGPADTDKLKRLAEEALKYDPTGWREVAFKEPEALAILALFAENEARPSPPMAFDHWSSETFSTWVDFLDMYGYAPDEIVQWLRRFDVVRK